MKKAIVIAGALLLGSSAVMADQKLAVEQDNFMRALGKSVYVTMLKMSKGELPYDQASVDAALIQLEQNVPKIPATFQGQSEGAGRRREVRVVAEDLGEQGRFRLEGASRVIDAVKGLKGKITDQASVKVAFETPPQELHRLSRGLSAQAAIGSRGPRPATERTG